jgi:hypothetical protein
MPRAQKARPVSHRRLLRAARQARRAYEAVVANYGDQADFAAQAKARLAALAAPTGRAGSGAEKGLTVRKLYDEGAVGALSPDGSHLTLLTGSEGLAVRELATGKVRELLTKSDKSSYAFAHLSVFSPDSRKIAYSWYDENEVFGVWLVNLMARETGRWCAARRSGIPSPLAGSRTESTFWPSATAPCTFLPRPARLSRSRCRMDPSRSSRNSGPRLRP